MSSLLEQLQLFEKLFCFLGRKHGGGLVKNEYLRTSYQGLDYFHLLLYPLRKGLQFFARGSISNLYFFADSPCPRHCLVAVKTYPSFRFNAQHHIFSYSKGRY